MQGLYDRIEDTDVNNRDTWSDIGREIPQLNPTTSRREPGTGASPAANRRNSIAHLLLAAVLPLLTGCVVTVERERANPPSGQRPEDPPEAKPLPLEAESDRRLPGSLGWALLSPAVPEAVVEVAHAGDARLTDEALDSLEAKVREHGGKKKVHRVSTKTLPPRPVYSADDVRSIVAEHRAHRSGDGRVSIYVMVLPGSFETEGVPGVAFQATSFAVFPDAIGARLPPGANVGAFQSAVVVHELGHLFGLVNLTGKGGFHEDDAHPGHAGGEDSVMHWAVESVSLTEVFASGPPSGFTGPDRREMDAIRKDTPSG